MKRFSKGLVFAGLFNILGVLTFTRGMRDFSVGTYFPELFSMWGMALIMVWGLAFMSMAGRYSRAPEILLVFVLEKVFYFGAWCWWQWGHFAQLPGMWKANWLAATFYSVYGPLDLAFAFFFLALFFRVDDK